MKRVEQAFNLVEIEGKSLKEASKIMGIKPDSVRTYIQMCEKYGQVLARQRRYNRENYLKINGKYIRHKKEPRPKLCQLCNTITARDYHHWRDMNGKIRGIWVCLSCHKVCEGIDKGLDITYKKVKNNLLIK